MQSVTAVIVNYRTAASTALAARSVLDDEPRCRVVVVDNSDMPSEARLLRDLLPAAAELLVAPRNLGFGGGCNWGVRHVPASVYWMVNPDVRVVPGCLGHLLEALDVDLRLGAVAPQQFLDSSLSWKFSAAVLPSPIDDWARRSALACASVRDRFDRAVRAETFRLWSAAPYSPVVRQRALSGSNLLVRHACLRSSGDLFDPRYFMFYEDSELSLRLRRDGWTLAIVPAARAVHEWRLHPYKAALMDSSRPQYFDNCFPSSPWLGRPARSCEPGAATCSIDSCAQPIRWPEESRLDLPADWRTSWMVELSPSVLFSPSVGHLGQGECLSWEASVLDAFPGARLYARVSSPLTGFKSAMVRFVDAP